MAPSDDGDRVVDLHLRIDEWSPLRGRLRSVTAEPGAEREFHGWTGLASVLSALVRDGFLEQPGSGG